MSANLIYSAIMSLDGYVADEDGNFEWSAPDEEVHRCVNDLTRDVGTFLLGRRMYDVLLAWETIDVTGQPDSIREFAEIWRGSDKIVFSSTLDAPSTARTRIERSFNPDSIRQLKAGAERGLRIGGPELAAHAIRAGLVDEYDFFVNPVAVGGGTPFLPGQVRLNLQLVDQRRFTNGVVLLRYQPSSE